jgi:hypothetical protein
MATEMVVKTMFNRRDNDEENWVLKRNCFDNGGNRTLRLCCGN